MTALLTDVEVAQILNVSRATVWVWLKTQENFPKPIRLSRGSTRWSPSEIEAYIAEKASGAK